MIIEHLTAYSSEYTQSLRGTSNNITCDLTPLIQVVMGFQFIQGAYPQQCFQKVKNKKRNYKFTFEPDLVLFIDDSKLDKKNLLKLIFSFEFVIFRLTTREIYNQQNLFDRKINSPFSISDLNLFADGSNLIE